MDLTQGTVEQKSNRAKKMMLWFGIASLLMSFAGLTSAFIVSSSRPDWVSEIQLPKAFLFSTITILISSVTFHLAKKNSKKENNNLTGVFLIITFILGIIFIILQFMGFAEIINMGYHFTGPTSNVTFSFIYLIATVHIAHVIAGLIVLGVIIFNYFRGKYKFGQTLGLELGAIFWHFLDFLWLYLILFFYFFR
ncbi:cytochrome c oxidase subunit 3 [Abyssalbus ytuae]|uniref:Cytochrome c oxidase subunit 3 n=1 Tax=Abyssalbus ytuae TaxID=2926907 RepID=A0A9E6ZU59_9FLAO|nr:cytochrome c oxidase subunit 3 [Abyssalbus ytuae]UOB18978.1 cytochrome c oxidase subunit 3 [Abyssalbus ytuae]